MSLPFSPKILGFLASVGLCVSVIGSHAESLVDFSAEADRGGSSGVLDDSTGGDPTGSGLFTDYLSTDLYRKQPAATQLVMIGNRQDPLLGEQRVERLDTTLFAVTDALVRTGPGTVYPAVTKMVPGQSARVTGKVSGWNWYQVALTNGGRGYIHGALLVKRPPLGGERRSAKAVSLPAAGQGTAGRGTAEQERQRATMIRKVQSVNRQFEKERQVLAAMQRRIKLRQTDNRLRLARPRPVEARSAALTAAASQASEQTRRFEILAYYEENTEVLRDQLSDYNKRFRLSVPDDSHDVAVKRINSFDVEDIEGERAQVRMSFDVGADGAGGKRTETATYSFSMRWTGESLDLLSHRTN